MNKGAAPRSAATSVEKALLDYFNAPGRFQLSLREPAAVFGAVAEVLQIAAGRGTSSTGARDSADQTRRAAIFFIGAALLYPGADHYAVFGYPPRTEPVDVKERYRLLMRLTHPDFAMAAFWPADAAVRVNRAYEVLSSPLLRREYDAQLERNRSRHPAAAAAGRRTASALPGGSLRQKAAAVVAALAGVGGIAFLLPGIEPSPLVERRPAPVSTKNRDAQVKAASAAAVLPTDLVSSDRLSAPQLETRPEEQIALRAAPETSRLARVDVPEMDSTRRMEFSTPESAPIPVPPPPTPTPAASTRISTAASAAATATPLLSPLGSPPLRPHLGAVMRAGEILPRVPSAQPDATNAVVSEPTVPASAFATSDSGVSAASPAMLVPAVAVPAPGRAASTLAVESRLASTAAPGNVSLAPTLADAQPVLTQLLGLIEHGSGEQLLRMLDAGARDAPGARRFSEQFDRLVHARRPVRLSQVVFEGEARDGVLLVTTRMRVHAGEPTIGSYGQRLTLRAEFSTRAGKTLLTGLSGVTE